MAETFGDGAGSSTMAKVVLEHVHKTYAGEKGREVHAVEDASLTIEDREFMVFVGPSGCGKSTTLRMIAGLEEISSGNISSTASASTTSRPRIATSPWSSRTTRSTRT